VALSTSSRVRGPLTVLICESNELSALKLRRLLELRGHAPAVVTLDEAIARIEADACDRLLIDAQLVPPTRLRTSVIALSSSSSPAAACREAGIAKCLAKPVLAAELWAALDD
jgi:CheY-like chemotaxis protein